MKFWFACLLLIAPWSFVGAQLIDTAHADPKWIWWGYDNSKMPLAVVTGVDLDSKNKVWISLCNEPNGGVGNFSKVDMSDFFHFSQFTRPNTIFQRGPCVMSLAVGKEDTAFFAPWVDYSTTVYALFDSFVVNNYDCVIADRYQDFRFLQDKIHALNAGGLQILGDTVCTFLRNNDLPDMGIKDYGYDAEGKLIFLDGFPNGCVYYQSDTGWACFSLPDKLRYHIFWPSPDFNPRKPNAGYMYLSHIRISPQQGLYRIKGEEITFYTKEQMGTPSNQAVVVKEDSRKTLWVGTTRGLASMYNEQWDTHEDMYWLKDAYITAIQFDYRGNVWIASTTGLTVYNPRGVNFGDVKPRMPEFKVFPNPFDNQINLEMDADFKGNIEYTLTNLYGKVMESGNIKREKPNFLPIKIDFSSLSMQNGYYILTIASENLTQHFKLVKFQP